MQHIFCKKSKCTGTHACLNVNTWKPNAMLRLICHFSNISGQWWPVGNISSCCLFCLTGCAASAISVHLKGYTVKVVSKYFAYCKIMQFNTGKFHKCLSKCKYSPRAKSSYSQKCFLFFWFFFSCWKPIVVQTF